jgi:hypothetical protein
MAGKTQPIPLQTTISGQQLPFRVGSERVMVDLVMLSKDVRGLVIGSTPFEPGHDRYAISISFSDVSISLLDDSFAEFLAITLRDIHFHSNASETSFSVKFLQVDDQISDCDTAVILSGNPSGSNPFIRAVWSSLPETPNAPEFELTIRPIDIRLDPVLIRDLLTFKSHFSPVIDVLTTELNNCHGFVLASRFHIQSFVINFMCKSVKERHPYFESKSQIPILQDRSSAYTVNLLSCENMFFSFDCLKNALLFHYPPLLKFIIGDQLGSSPVGRTRFVLSQAHCSGVSSESFRPATPSRFVRATGAICGPNVQPSVLHSGGSCLLADAGSDHPQLPKRRQTQAVYPGRVSSLSSEQRAVESINKKVHPHGRIHRVYFIESCNDSKTIVCVTNYACFLYAVDGFAQIAQFTPDCILGLTRPGKRLEVEVKETRGWRKKTTHLLTFQEEDSADELHCILQSHMIGSRPE